MGTSLERFTEGIAIAADGIHAASQSTSEKLTGAVDISKFREVSFLIDTGVMGASGTVDFQIKGSNASGGTYTAITGTAITQLVKASNDGNYVVVSILSETIQALGLGYKFIKGSLVPGTAASLASVHVFGKVSRYEPASVNNPAQVVQLLPV